MVPTVQPDRDVPESFFPQRLNKVEKLTATAVSLAFSFPDRLNVPQLGPIPPN
jgi:hypothetical protein